jgi:hypothetical protein
MMTFCADLTWFETETFLNLRCHEGLKDDRIFPD